MLKLKNFHKLVVKKTGVFQCFALVFIIVLISSFNIFKHPYYITVVDLEYNRTEKILKVSAKFFSNDLEEALKKTAKKNIDILNPKNKAELDTALYYYIKKRFTITDNLKKSRIDYIGYEKEDAIIWVYLEIKNMSAPKNLHIETKLLYDFIPQEINIVHCKINDIQKSYKVTNPESKIDFVF